MESGLPSATQETRSFRITPLFHPLGARFASALLASPGSPRTAEPLLFLSLVKRCDYTQSTSFLPKAPPSPLDAPGAPVLCPSSCTTFLPLPESVFKAGQALSDHHPPELHLPPCQTCLRQILGRSNTFRRPSPNILRNDKLLQTSPSSFRAGKEKQHLF